MLVNQGLVKYLLNTDLQNIWS